MKTALKAIVGAAALSIAALTAPAPAHAAVDVYFGFGAPARPYYPPYRPYYRPYDPCYDRYYRPAYCALPVYYGPIFLGGAWVNGPHHYRMIGGRREFWVHDGWHAARFHRGGFHR